MLDSAQYSLDKDPYLTEKISYKLKWITRHLDLGAIFCLIDTGSFRNAKTMKDLLNDPTFNVKMCN
jgi:hypothetical protein